MKRLIWSEIKKVFKRKSVIIVVALLTLLTSYMTYIGYQNQDITHTWDNQIADLSGKSLNKIETYRYIDETLHQYKGEFTQEKYQQIKDDYLKLMKKYYSSALDEKKMKRVYGKNYQKLVDMSLNNQLTSSNIHNYVELDVPYYSDEEDIYHINLYYKNENILRGIVAAYTGRNYESQGFNLDYAEELFDEGYLGKYNRLFNGEQYTSNDTDDVINQLIQDNLERQSKNFDSVIPQNIYYNVLNYVLIPLFLPTLFVIIIVLSNIYGIERQYRMEQIIYPTKMTKAKISLAKWLTGCMLAIGIMFLQLLATLIVGNILLPFHSLFLVPMDMAISMIESSLMRYQFFELYGFVALLAFISALALATLILLLSYLSRTRFFVVIVMMLSSFIYILADVFSGRGNIIPLVIRVLHPNEMINFQKYLVPSSYTADEFIEPMMQLGDVFISVIWVIGFVWIVINIVSMICILKDAKRNTVRYE